MDGGMHDDMLRYQCELCMLDSRRFNECICNEKLKKRKSVITSDHITNHRNHTRRRRNPQTSKSHIHPIHEILPACDTTTNIDGFRVWKTLECSHVGPSKCLAFPREEEMSSIAGRT
ncbi:hypothetical protein VTL71DRAFT_11792 [Oculimacula yallundae]|uniref:Recombination activating protein 1 n=1 Tax=Oculimacula yallundae TaxID=86028 RepID=A0ABR4CRF6_9HELO